jgi:hypothetical protein
VKKLNTGADKVEGDTLKTIEDLARKVSKEFQA